MLILVGVTVTVALQGGLFKTAKDAAQRTKEAAEAEVNMYEAEYYIAKANGETDAETLTDYILDTKYGGLKIGDYVAYDEGTHSYTPDTNKGVGTNYDSYDSSTGYVLTTSELGTKDFGWRVLGVTELGELELVSDDVSNENIYVANEQGWLYGPDELNKICNELYGKGLYASTARSINVNDINKITGYNPEKTGDGKIYNQGKVGQYGNEVTFTLNSEGKVQYTSSVASGSYDITSLKHPDGRVLGQNSVESITVKTDYYYYFTASRQTGPQEFSPAYLDSNSDEYKLLFRNLGDTSDISSYFLADSSYGVGNYGCEFDIRYVSSGGYVGGNPIIYNNGKPNYQNHKIRPVVTLKSGITITKDADHDGTSAKPCTISE